MSVNWEKVRATIETFGTVIYPYEDCQLGPLLGVGLTMNVFQGTCLINNEVRPVAFKEHHRLSNRGLRQSELNDILRHLQHEISMMERLKLHANVVQMLGITFRATRPFLIFELGSEALDNFLADRRNKGQPVSWYDKQMLCLDVLWGIRGLHDARIVHGDLKADGVLVFTNGSGPPKAKLADIGYSSWLSSSQKDDGVTNFLAPENTPYHPELQFWCKKPAQDIYGLGMIVYQIATDGSIPYDGTEDILAAKAADPNLRNLLQQLPPDTPEEFRHVIHAATRLEPSKRATLDAIEQILQKSLTKPLSQSTRSTRSTQSGYSALSMYSTHSTLRTSIADQEAVIERQERRRAARELLGDYQKRHVYDGDCLFWAANEGFVDVLRLLVDEFGIDVNLRYPGNLLGDKAGWTALHYAASNGHGEIVRALAGEFGADVNLKTEFGKTALHYAAEDGHPGIVKMLAVELKADVDSKTMNGWTAMHYAARAKHNEVIKVLAGVGADMNTKDCRGRTAMHLAAERGNVDTVRTLVECGGDMDIVNSEGWTPLHEAAVYGKLGAVQALSELHADVNSKITDGWGKGSTALDLAAERKRKDVVEVLKSVGAVSGKRSRRFLSWRP